MPAIFTHASGTINFTRAPLRKRGSIELLQALVKNSGGQPFAFDSLAEEDLIVLTWRRMTTPDRSALETFLVSTAKGMVETFTYTDVDAVATTVRFAYPDLLLSEVAQGGHEVTIVLEAA